MHTLCLCACNADIRPRKHHFAVCPCRVPHMKNILCYLLTGHTRDTWARTGLHFILKWEFLSSRIYRRDLSRDKLRRVVNGVTLYSPLRSKENCAWICSVWIERGVTLAVISCILSQKPYYWISHTVLSSVHY